jgi:deoxycytidylate deaminase
MTKEAILKIGYFNLARTESLKVDFRSRIGSVLVKGRKPVSIGRNKPLKTHPLLRKYDSFKTMHAEIDACIGIDRHLIMGSILYVYREGADGNLAMSKPCEMCQKILKELGVKKVMYTIENGIDEIKL